MRPVSSTKLRLKSVPAASSDGGGGGGSGRVERPALGVARGASSALPEAVTAIVNDSAANAPKRESFPAWVRPTRWQRIEPISQTSKRMFGAGQIAGLHRGRLKLRRTWAYVPLEMRRRPRVSQP